MINLDNYADVGKHWIVYFAENIKFFIAIVSVLNMSLKKLKNLLGIKI